MPSKYLIAVLVISCAVPISCATVAIASPSETERKLVAIKAATMSADYRGDLKELQSLRERAAELSNDPKLGYLADYWSGFASWRIVVNGAGSALTKDAAIANLNQAVTAFETSFAKRPDFADAWASAAAVHGWLAAYNTSTDPAAMNREIDTFKRQINRAAELEPNNPRVLWIQAVPYRVLPPERGGDINRAIELYGKMAEISPTPNPQSPLPDWGKPEALMSLASADSTKPSPDLDKASVEAADALRLQPEWHFVKEVLIPGIESKKRVHDFDYLLGDWEFTGTSQQFGEFHGRWSAARLADGEVFDEYRITGDHGETYYVTRTVRAYNSKHSEWELVSTETGGGLQNRGTARRDGTEMRIEQTFGASTPTPSLWRIRYYDIQPDRFSWAGDRSDDNGKSWVNNFQTIEAKRIGPSRSLELTSSKDVQH